LDTLAVTYLAVGRLEEAEAALRDVAIDARTAPDDIARTMLTLARVRRQRGDLEGADEALGRCVAVARDHDIGEVSVQAQGERAELSAAQGRFEEAFAQLKDYHERLLAQHAVERDARARMLHAIFEAAEARRESERFRELSYRDPLTTLRNRRFVDESLTRQIEACTGDGQPLTLAFIDLDHFKRINDTCSHEVGDEVLGRVAALLERHAASQEWAFAARMGGEEFLLVLPGLGGDLAGALLETVREDLEGIDWHGVTAGLPVTASVGTSTAPDDGDDRLQLLATADRRLYLAKAAGRNRVVGTG
jgi:diguanylate cyclase (GGDEF)-like protein